MYKVRNMLVSLVRFYPYPDGFAYTEVSLGCFYMYLIKTMRNVTACSIQSTLGMSTEISGFLLLKPGD